MQYIVYGIFPIGIVLAHIGIVPFVFFPEWFSMDQRFDLSEQIDIALIIAPLTSASVVSAIKFSADNKAKTLEEMPKIGNSVFAFIAGIVMLVFFATIYMFLWRYQTTGGADIGVLKGMIGIVEVFFGAAYAIIVSSIFSNN